MNLNKQSWEYVPIGNFATIQYGSSHKSTDSAEGFKTFRMNELINGLAVDNGLMKTTEISYKEFEKYRLNKGNILFNRTNSFEHVGRTGIFLLEGNYMAASYLLKLEVDKTVADPYFLNIIMNSDWFQTNIKTYATKAVGQANINAKSLSRFIVPLPSLAEQRQIATLFRSIDASVEKVKEQEKNLLKLKNKLLSDLFNVGGTFGKYLKADDFEKLKFEKIAHNISERVEPQKTDLTIYVGLEHLEAENLKIERTGTPADVIGAKLKIYKGDIIFGKRRAYLRKVAVSHFDGIASAHSMILRANQNNIEMDFLPYFMQSDTFMNRAVQISEGSLSPTIKWKTLASQEFLLPKKEKQKELSNLFKQFDSTIEQLKQQKTTLKNLKQKLLNEILG
jgi:restriction endonuclease S subunit